MKLKDLTKKQRERIEADELGRELIKTDCDKWHCSSYHIRCRKCGTKFEENKQEIKRTIKRIDDEIEFLEEPRDWTFPCGNNILIDMNCRIRDLKGQKELYELVEQLE